MENYNKGYKSKKQEEDLLFCNLFEEEKEDIDLIMQNGNNHPQQNQTHLNQILGYTNNRNIGFKESDFANMINPNYNSYNPNYNQNYNNYNPNYNNYPNYKQQFFNKQNQFKASRFKDDSAFNIVDIIIYAILLAVFIFSLVMIIKTL